MLVNEGKPDERLTEAEVRIRIITETKFVVVDFFFLSQLTHKNIYH